MRLDACSREAQAAKAGGAGRFCMGAAWRAPKDRDLDQVCAMVEGVKAIGLETCVTLGMLNAAQSRPAQGGRPRLLQPQSRYLAGILWKNHHHPHLSGAARHAGARARRGHPCVLRRHRRHGRGARGSGRHDPPRSLRFPSIPKACRSTCWCRSKARRLPMAPRSIRSTSCARLRSHALPCRNPWCGSRPAASNERRDAGPVFPGRRQFDFLRPKAAHHAQSRPGSRSPAPRPARACSDEWFALISVPRLPPPW